MSKNVPVQIAFRSNPAAYSFAGNARLINAYAEKIDGKDPMAVMPSPGIVQFSAVTDTPGRGMIFCDDLDAIYSIHSSGAFKVLSDGTATRVGTVPGNDQVQLSRNQADPAQINVHTSAGEFYIQADTVKTVTDDDLDGETIVTVENSKGYALYGADTGKVYFSSINDCAAIDGLDFFTAEQSADGLANIKAFGDDVIFFGTQTTEYRRVTSDVDLPFQLIAGATQKRGMIAPLGPVDCDNSVIFPGEDNGFFRITNYVHQKISEHYHDRLLENDPARESVMGQSFDHQGHSFANFTGSTWSVGWDAATKLWHDRSSYGLPYWRARHAVRAWGRTIVQDALSGNLGYFDKDTFTEFGDPLIWGVDTAFLHNFPNGGIVDALYLDMATGVGDVLASSQGYDPILMLSWSTDGGATFKGNRQLKLGKRGERVRVVTRRLGRFGPQGIQFRLRVSDPNIRSLVAMEASVRPLKR